MYNLILRLIYVLLHITPIKKYRTWISEQKKIFQKFKKNDEKVIWIHCASLGEYEQIKAFIPKLKEINPIINITFFSASGYVNFKDFDLISQISYLPLDLKSKMKSFINHINPMMVIVANNDVWPNMVTYLKKNNVPLYLVGCKVKKEKTNNWFIRKYYRKYFAKFSHVFTQDEFTFKFLKTEKILNCSVIGNTRINQILLDKKQEFKCDKICAFIDQKKTIVYGSVDENDYSKIIHTINTNKDLKHIIVPHEINIQTITKLQHQLSENHVLYSKIENIKKTHENILIIDKFGILKYIYKYSEIAYVGGGFNTGVHNTLEPAVYGNFILFGPKHKNFPETNWLVEKQIGKSIKNRFEFEKELNYFLQTSNSTNLKNSTSKTILLKRILPFLKSKTQKLDILIQEIKHNLKKK